MVRAIRDISFSIRVDSGLIEDNVGAKNRPEIIVRFVNSLGQSWFKQVLALVLCCTTVRPHVELERRVVTEAATGLTLGLLLE